MSTRVLVPILAALSLVAPAQTGLAAPPGLEHTVFVVQGSASCAGVLVEAPEEAGVVVATAYHCVAPGGRPRVTLRDGTWANGRVRAVDRARDLALIEMDGMDGLDGRGAVSIAGALPEPGDTVDVYGHPLGASLPGGFFAGTLRWAVSRGVVSAVGDNAIQLTAPVNPGNSGGPVVDEDGDLVGIVSRRLGGDGMGFAGRADALRPMLDAEPRRLGALGGVVSAEVVVQSNGIAALPIGVGGRLEVSIRDRFVVSSTVTGALGARWQAVRFRTSAFQPFEARGALRQRIGRGPWALRLDAWAGAGWIETISAGDPEPLQLERASRWAPMVGGRAAIRNVALDYGVALTGPPFVRLQAVWRWPGTLFVL